MPDLTEAQSVAKHQETTYAGITADDVYKSALASDIEKLGKAFTSLNQNHDYNDNGVLELAELKKGAVLKQHETAEIALFNTYMLTNFNKLAGLANSRGDSKASGVSETDLAALQAITSPDRQEYINKINKRANCQLESRESQTSALIGLASGLAITGIAYGASKMLPPKFYVPLAIAGIAAPILGFTAGGDIGLYRHRLANDLHAHGKIANAEYLVSSANYPAVTATTIYNNLLNQRLKQLDANASGEQDIDRNGFIDRVELDLSITSKTGDQKHNTFLAKNYDDLELLSRDLSDRGTENGISVKAIQLLTNESIRSKYFSQQHSLADQWHRETYDMAREYRLPLAVGTGALFFGGHQFVPSKYKPAYALCAAVATAALTSAAPTLAADFAGRGNAKFLRNQESAIGRVLHRM